MPAASALDAWRANLGPDVDPARLVSRLHEGLAVAPLYLPPDRPDPAGSPGVSPFTRGLASPGWERRQEVDLPDLAQARRELDFHRAHGAVTLRIGGRVPVDGLEDLDGLLAGVDLAVTGVDWDADTVAGAALLALADRRGVPRAALRGAVGADPSAVLARTGAMGAPPGTAWKLAAGLLGATGAGLQSLTLDVRPIHEAGANAVQEIAVALAAAVETLRGLASAGTDPASAAGRLRCVVAVGTDVFLEVARLRALRALFAKVMAACGVAPEGCALVLHGTGSRRVATVRDPWVNLLRGTAETFAAAVGGLDSFSVLPFDAPAGIPDADGRRLAANTQLVLDEESQLGCVRDPAAGSGYVEALTAELAASGWAAFQAIEARGGLIAALRVGAVQADVAAVAAARAQAVARRKDAIVGVSEFPDVQERPLARPPWPPAPAPAAPVAVHLGGTPAEVLEALVAAIASGASLSGLRAALAEGAPTAPALPAVRVASGFEALRDASDAALERNGRRPAVFLASLGPLAAHRVRTAFARNFLAAGGIDALGGDGWRTATEVAAAFRASRAAGALICGTDETYAERAAGVAEALRGAGAGFVALAGRPDATLRAAGVGPFVHLGCDALELLTDLHARLGVTP